MSNVIILEDYKKDRDYDRIMDEIFRLGSEGWQVGTNYEYTPPLTVKFTHRENISTEYTDKQMSPEALDRLLKDIGGEDESR